MSGIYCIMIGIDLISACAGTARFEVSHGFADSWSAGFETGLYLNVMRNREETLESIHKNDLSDTGYKLSGNRFRDTFQETGIHLQYWTGHVFSGAFITAGIIHKDRQGIDCTLGFGYAVPIWKGFKSIISYRTGIIDTIRNKKMSADGIRIGLNYIF